MSSFAELPEQADAKRLLSAALAEGAAHAYLFHGPAGVGKRAAAVAFAGELLGDRRRVEARTHPDLTVIEALGEMIRIDVIRALHHDLHMRPFEATKRVYLLFDAHLLGEDAADALLKDLEEPPEYARLVLVADQLGPIAETICSRCQLVPFHRLSEGAVRSWIARRAPELGDGDARTVARVAAGRLDRAERLLDADARERREALLGAARATYLDEAFDPATAAALVTAAATARGLDAKEREATAVEHLDLTARESEQRVRRAQRGAEREELLASLEELEVWFRDVLVVYEGAESAVTHADRLDELRADAALVGSAACEAAQRVRAAWRIVEELNVTPSLAFEALFVGLRRVFAPERKAVPHLL